MDPPYKAYTGIDYGPLQVPPPKTKITNVTGVFVETPLECAVRCNDEKLCNAASFYGENPVGSWPAGGLTCWLKTITVPCEVPPDYQASEYPDTIFLLAQDEDYCGALSARTPPPSLSLARPLAVPWPNRQLSAAAASWPRTAPCLLVAGRGWLPTAAPRCLVPLRDASCAKQQLVLHAALGVLLPHCCGL